METKPLLNYKTPSYPRIEVVFSDPDLLLKNMPVSWRGNKLIVTAMISFSLSACKGQSDDPGNVSQMEQLVNDNTNRSDSIISKQDSAKIAPIFVHGDGVGASGCVMIAPPVYLSEEDALNIISGELKKVGLTFNDKFKGDPIMISRKKVVYNENENIKNWEERYSDTTEIKNLYPDAYNKDLNMIIEFVSYEDYEAFGDEKPEFSSVSEYLIKSSAEKIQKVFKEKGKYSSVVFYDPVGWGDISNREQGWDEMEKEGRKKAVEMLKLQVADFIEWLKNEGIILNKK
jgi:hypothetical protein